jgi:hypothetical protein
VSETTAAATGARRSEDSWWISGFRENDRTVVAAVKAPTEDAARELVYAAYDARPDRIEFRFVQRCDTSPFSDRFPRADWMQWEEEGRG